MSVIPIERIFVFSVIFGILAVLGMLMSLIVCHALKKNKEIKSAFSSDEVALITNRSLSHGKISKEDIADDTDDTDDIYEADSPAVGDASAHKGICRLITLYSGTGLEFFVGRVSSLKIVGNKYDAPKQANVLVLPHESANELALISFDKENPSGLITNIGNRRVYVNFEKLMEAHSCPLPSDSVVHISESLFKVLIKM